MISLKDYIISILPEFRKIYGPQSDYVLSVLASLSEEQIKELIKSLAGEDALTRLESDLLANDPNAKKYLNFEEFMKDMDN